MQRYSNVVSSSQTGLPVSGATVLVKNRDGSTATIYGTNDTGGTPITNPITTGSDGSFAFYAPNGRYDLAVTGAGGSGTVSDVMLFDPAPIPNAQVGTTYTFALTDANGLVTFANAAPVAVTIPLNATVPFPVGTRIDCVQDGAGKVTFAGEAGVTINSLSGNKSISDQYVGVTLIKEATDEWYLVGSLVA